MLGIKFKNYPEKFYNCEEYILNGSFVILTGINSYPENLGGGFSVYKYLNPTQTEYTLIEDFSDYDLLWTKETNKLVFSNDHNVYNTYLLYTVDNFIIQEITVPKEMTGAALLINSGIGRENKEYQHIQLYDEDGFYLYKVVNGRKVSTTEEDKNIWLEQKNQVELAEVKKIKIKEINETCQKMIVKGVTINDSHYSYEVVDQNNISNCMNLAIQTGLSVPYHADNESCRLFTRDELIELYFTEEINLTHHITYSNQLKLYIDTLTSVEDVNSIKYGETELIGEYLNNYNTMMAQAESILRAVTEPN